jgi:hypothetical protein
MIIANNTAMRIGAFFWDIQFLDEGTGVGALVLANSLE